MILYVNGDSHSTGAEAVNKYCFAEDDPQYKYLGRLPHPDNLFVSYGNVLAKNLSAELYCDAESAGSNDRIIRTTKHYLRNNRPDLIVIGWATWEREEWFNEGQYWQINAGGVGADWPDAVKQQYKYWVLNAQPYKRANFWHEEIYKLHLELLDKNIKHLFFNTYTAFNYDFITQFNWKYNYLNPYLDDYTYYHWLSNQGFETVNPNSFHFGPDAHHAWANHLTNIIKESIMVK